MKAATPPEALKSPANHLKMDETRAVLPSLPGFTPLVAFDRKAAACSSSWVSSRAGSYGSARRSGHDSDAHTRLLEHLAQDVVLDLIERALRSSDRGDLLLPDGREEGPAVLDAGERVLIEHGLDGGEVVRV